MADWPGKMEGVVMQDILSYYTGKKVFITGHTGFKGSWLACCLKMAGANVKGYALAPEYEGLFSLLEKLDIVESVLGDIRHKDKLRKEIEIFQPDFVFHLAAQPLVRRSYEIPAETFEINVAGTANLLEIISQLKLKCTTVIITTDKVYENREQHILYKETDRLGGYDPYSASKACTEIVAGSFRSSFFNLKEYDRHQKAIATARAGNVIGGGDWSKDRIVPDIIRSLKAGQSIAVRNPSAVRPWQHVLEPIAGYLKLGTSIDTNPASLSPSYNFGPLPADHLTVKELVEIAIEKWGAGSWTDASKADELHEANLLKLDISLAQNELKWNPRLSATDAIQWTVEWYKQSSQQQLDFTYQQIKQYFQL